MLGGLGWDVLGALHFMVLPWLLGKIQRTCTVRVLAVLAGAGQ